MDVATDRRALKIAGAETNRHPREDDDARLDGDDTVDHDLTVRDVDAGLHDDGISDADLGGGHCQPVREARQDRHAERLEPGLGAVEHEREERVTDPHQPERLHGRVGSRTEFVRLGAVATRDLRVFEDRPEERRMLRPDALPEIRRLRIGTATARHTESLSVVARR